MTRFIGIYDVFSAGLAARRFEGIFVSGYGMAASTYGLPDVGFITWTDMLQYVGRVRTVTPGAFILVDIDDGYVDTEVAAHVTSRLEAMGASAVVIEDQKRPRRCGHVAGKQVLELYEFIPKLERVLSARDDLFVVARTDASDPDEILRRVRAFEEAGADAVLVDGIADLELLREVGAAVRVPRMFNQIHGGRSPAVSLARLRELGVSMVNYSTPALFAAQKAVEATLDRLLDNDGDLGSLELPQATLAECNEILDGNLGGRALRPLRALVHA
jgi:2-methylisocitrate lyase-like PEP mutase family enzyme